MHLDRYSKLSLTGAGAIDIARRIAAWAIPADAAFRMRRRAVGMPRGWVAEQLLEDVDLNGDAELRAQARWGDDRNTFLCRLVHHDPDDARIFWHTVFRVVGDSTATACTVECGVARSTQFGVALAPRAYPPGVFTSLLDEADGIRVTERALTLPTLEVKEADDARALVDDLLLRPGRETPLVVIAGDLPPGTSAHVDPSVVARKLKGLAVVAVLRGAEVASAYRATVVDTGLGREFACFHGGIHTYGATLRVRDDHRLWLGRSLEELPHGERSERVGEVLARRLALSLLPQGYFSLLEEHDRATRAARSRRESVRVPAQTGGAVSAAEHASALELMEEAHKRATALETQVRDAEHARDTVGYEKQQLELDLELERQQTKSLRDALEDRRRGAQRSALSDGIRSTLDDILRKRDPVPLASLRLIEALYVDRVVVLPEAFESAEEAMGYRNPRDVLNLLIRLATDYWDKMTTAPASARTVFTDKEYASTGSEKEMNNAACVTDRTFTYGDRTLVMWSHLKAGGNGGPDKCLRIHFAWVPEEKKIVIGHCGRHLKEA